MGRIGRIGRGAEYLLNLGEQILVALPEDGRAPGFGQHALEIYLCSPG